MKHISKLTFACLFMFFTFQQCESVSDYGTPGSNDKTGGDRTANTELSTPANLAENQSTDIEFSWKPADDAEEYLLHISADEEFSSPAVDTLINGNAYQANALEANTSYFWKVLPQGTENGSEWSDTWQFATGDEDTKKVSVALSTPSDGDELEAGDILFEWEEISESAEYHFQLATSDDFSKPLADSIVSNPIIEISGLDGGNYHWRVNPILQTATGTWSETRSLTANGTTGDDDGGNSDNGENSDDNDSDHSDDPDNSDEAPAVEPVSLVSPAQGATDQPEDLTFEWEAIEGFTEYQIQVSTDPSFNSTEIDKAIEGIIYEAAELAGNEFYYWRVRSGGEENWSATGEFQTRPAPDTNTPVPSGDFVTASNGNFNVNGEVFRFAGTNAYYLPNYEKIDVGVVDRAMDAFQEAGITVVRMWAFYDGFDCGYSANDSNENVIQTGPGQYSESALRDLDRVIAKGKERGIRFILPFVNYWDELGGICQYNTWAGASNPSRNMTFFINNSDTQKWFRDYIDMLLNRVNTETGVAYKDEPAIFSWQIVNEGRNSGRQPEELRDWYQEMAQYIKSIDSNHMVGTGEEGFDEGTPSEYSADEYSNTYVLRSQTGSSYVLNTAIPEIDYGNAHWYGPDFGFGHDLNDDQMRAQRAWITDHKAIAENSNKPFVLGEYGFPGWGDSRQDAYYTELWSLAEEIQLDGSMIWQLTADHVKCSEFGGNICWPGGREDTALFNKFRDHIETMNNNR